MFISLHDIFDKQKNHGASYISEKKRTKETPLFFAHLVFYSLVQILDRRLCLLHIVLFFGLWNLLESEKLSLVLKKSNSNTNALRRGGLHPPEKKRNTNAINLS
jgi:hypothetical protein